MRKTEQTGGGMGIKKIFFGFVFLTLLIAGLAGYWLWSNIYKSVGSDESPVYITVAQGEGREQVLIKLKQLGLIADVNSAKIYLKYLDDNTAIKAGRHTLNKSMTLPQIMEELEKNPQIDAIWITVPEGKRTDEVAAIVSSAYTAEGLNFNTEIFLGYVDNPSTIAYADSSLEAQITELLPSGKPLEGFLYPETYAVPKTYTESQVIELMLKQFTLEISELPSLSNDRTFYENLTLASIVDKESYNEEDRPSVASVFNNRLDIDMMLQSDATVNYALGKSERRPTYADLLVDSPYNTYKYTGLPPTPINNPRIESLKHSINPPQSDNLFFLHDEAGKAYFGKSINDHNRNVCKYLDKTC